MSTAKKKTKKKKQTNPVGRPSLYKPEYCKDLINYFDRPAYKEVMIKTTNKHGNVVEIPEERASDFPSLAGFAIQLGVCRDTLHEWASKHKDFSDAYKRAKDFQENFLAINGNKGLLPGAFAIFTAKNVLGWRDKQKDESDVVINNLQNESDEELEARINQLLKER